MENEPSREREPYTFTLEFDGGQTFRCNPHNTMAFIHSQEPQGDHLFIYKQNEDGELVWGQYVFRRRLAQFDDLIIKMAHDYEIIEKDILNDEDREHYNNFIISLGEKSSLEEKPAVEPENAPELDWISPRAERIGKIAVEWLIWNLHHGHIADDGSIR